MLEDETSQKEGKREKADEAGKGFGGGKAVSRWQEEGMGSREQKCQLPRGVVRSPGILRASCIGCAEQ